MARLPAAASAGDVVEVLDRDGVVVIERLADARTMAAVARELDPWMVQPAERSPLGNNAFTGFRTLRRSGLIAKSGACGELAMHRTVLDIADRVLGPQCARFQLSFTQAIKIAPGERAQAAHRDSAMYPLRRPGPEVFLNVIWALTDFTAENGATRFHVGSHRWSDERAVTAADPVTVAEMPSGSAVVYYGSCLHGGGANQTEDQFRTGIAFGYTLGWLRQEENQYLAVPPDVARILPVELQRLIGYAEHYPFLGWYEGADTALLRGGQFRKRYATAVHGGVSTPVETILRDDGHRTPD